MTSVADDRSACPSSRPFPARPRQLTTLCFVRHKGSHFDGAGTRFRATAPWQSHNLPTRPKEAEKKARWGFAFPKPPGEPDCSPSGTEARTSTPLDRPHDQWRRCDAFVLGLPTQSKHSSAKLCWGVPELRRCHSDNPPRKEHSATEGTEQIEHRRIAEKQTGSQSSQKAGKNSLWARWL